MPIITSIQIIQEDREIRTDAFELIFQNEGEQTVKIMEQGERDGFTLNPPEVSGGIDIPQRLKLSGPTSQEEESFLRVLFSGSGTKRLVIIKRRSI